MKNYLWVAIEKFGGVFLKVIGMILLARILTPTDFGLFGMIFVISALGQVFVDSGMGGALIKKKYATECDYITVFSFNIFVSSAIWLMLYFTSDVIAKFYNEERISQLVPLLGLVLVIRSLTLVPVTKLTKELNFKVQSNISLVSYIIAFIFGYIMAMRGFGVYALVYMSIFEVTIYCFLIFYYSKYKPKIGFNVQSFKELYPFGVKLSMASVIRTVYENALNVLIGKFFGPQLLGFYYQASKINDVFIGTTTNVINKAAFPILVHYTDNKVIMKIKMQTLLSNVCWLTFVVCVLLSSNSKEIILITFGEQWITSAWMLEIISLAGFGMILEATTRCFLKSHGLAGTILMLEFKKRFIGLMIILLSSFGDIRHMLLAYVLTTIVSSVLNMLKVSEMIGYTFLEQVRDIYKPFIASLLTYFLISVLRHIDVSGYLLSILLTLFFPSVFYLLLLYFFSPITKLRR